jgi:hypothetical protein
LLLPNSYTAGISWALKPVFGYGKKRRKRGRKAAFDVLRKDTRSLATMVPEEDQIINCLGSRIIITDSLVCLAAATISRSD